SNHSAPHSLSTLSLHDALPIWNVAPGRQGRIALDPEDGDPGDADLDVQLPEGFAGKRERRAARIAPRHAAAPRFRRGLHPEREDAAAVHSPEPGIESERHARVKGRLDVVPALDQRIEVPPRELESGQESHDAARREKAGAREGPDSSDRPEAHRHADRRKGIALRATDLEAD